MGDLWCAGCEPCLFEMAVLSDINLDVKCQCRACMAPLERPGLQAVWFGRRREEMR